VPVTWRVAWLRVIGGARCSRADRFATPPNTGLHHLRGDVADGQKRIWCPVYPRLLRATICKIYDGAREAERQVLSEASDGILQPPPQRTCSDPFLQERRGY
jgi:hypothetical protein